MKIIDERTAPMTSRLWLLIATLALLPALQACKTGCEEWCEEFNANDGSMLDVSLDCEADAWHDAETCNQCEEVITEELFELGIAVTLEPDFCDQYY